MIAGHEIPLWVIPFGLIGLVFLTDFAGWTFRLHRRRMEEVKRWQHRRKP